MTPSISERLKWVLELTYQRDGDLFYNVDPEVDGRSAYIGGNIERNRTAEVDAALVKCVEALNDWYKRFQGQHEMTNVALAELTAAVEKLEWK